MEESGVSITRLDIQVFIFHLGNKLGDKGKAVSREICIIQDCELFSAS